RRHRPRRGREPPATSRPPRPTSHSCRLRFRPARAGPARWAGRRREARRRPYTTRGDSLPRAGERPGFRARPSGRWRRRGGRAIQRPPPSAGRRSTSRDYSRSHERRGIGILGFDVKAYNGRRTVGRACGAGSHLCQATLGGGRPPRHPLQRSESLADKIERVLVITAHPDDSEFGAGGTIAKLVKEGCEVSYVIVTNGNKGSSDRSMTWGRLGGVGAG